MTQHYVAAQNYGSLQSIPQTGATTIMAWQNAHIVRTFFAPMLPSFIAITAIPTMEIMSELIEDALKSSDWKAEPHESYYEEPGSNFQRYREIMVYKRDGFEIHVKPDSIEFSGPKVWTMNTNIDLISDSDTIEAFIEWIYNGGRFPFLDSQAIRRNRALTPQKQNYPTSNDHLTRKNNRKK